MTYFHNITTLEELRKAYHRLALQFHPDRGGSEETMKAINNEFERLSDRLISGNMDFTEARKAYETQVSEEIMEAINAVINLPGLIIEIIGSWVWLTGNTYEHREAIKEAHFKFSRQKLAWYWHSGEYRKRNGKTNSLQEVRAFWGSETVQANPKEERILA
jgi:curved DNA-binding protein CbpA